MKRSELKEIVQEVLQEDIFSGPGTNQWMTAVELPADKMKILRTVEKIFDAHHSEIILDGDEYTVWLRRKSVVDGLKYTPKQLKAMSTVRGLKKVDFSDSDDDPMNATFSVTF